LQRKYNEKLQEMDPKSKFVWIQIIMYFFICKTKYFIYIVKLQSQNKIKNINEFVLKNKFLFIFAVFLITILLRSVSRFQNTYYYLFYKAKAILSQNNLVPNFYLFKWK
jgi:hypothetical protein